MAENSHKKVTNLTGVYCAEDLLSRSGGGLFSLMRIAMTRSAELAEGKPSLLESPASNKIITIVFEEIASGLIVIKNKNGK